MIATAVVNSSMKTEHKAPLYTQIHSPESSSLQKAPRSKQMYVS